VSGAKTTLKKEEKIEGVDRKMKWRKEVERVDIPMREIESSHLVGGDERILLLGIGGSSHV